ncbi:GDP-mannose 4,6-dehydratase [Candidatus Peribacteria bacterium RIFCSPHIGHO2_02_FULL_49_16]|nr:MAG: GDP-mannose 4,6-dehydratase [Candidatus Peribacteria bacterium RIFCSPHIGHO2_01_FULL_49_38]OGJ58854.1 MAG: GDP-mannose 4,6-dehydratase [Candidatus Peribacteria bacterium RIFCSPHIGHO2_02_FULL_49_16]
MKKKALILGITGQDGSYLAEILLEKGYEVHGLIRRSATGNTRNIEHILDKITLHRGDLGDVPSLFQTIHTVHPQEIYNEADQDHAGWSYELVDYASDITGGAVGRILEIIRQTDPTIRFFQPLTSNMFGLTETKTQNEKTLLYPQSPYACAKVYAWMLIRYYRDVHHIFASTAIFFNHESPRRTESYVSRKITKAAARISIGLQDKLSLGDIGAEIDFGYAKEYMEAAWNILQLDHPDDFVIGTGESHSVREFLEEAFAVVGLNVDEHVEIDASLFRPGKTSTLVADYAKAKKTFGFEPKVKYKDLVRIMLGEDKKEAEKELILRSQTGA